MTPRPVKKINGTLASSLGRAAKRTHRAAVHTSKKTTVPLRILKEASCAAIQASSEAMVALDRMPKVGFGLDCPASICEANIFRSPATTRKAMLNMAVLKAAPKKLPFRCGVTYPMANGNPDGMQWHKSMTGASTLARPFVSGGAPSRVVSPVASHAPCLAKRWKAVFLHKRHPPEKRATTESRLAPAYRDDWTDFIQPSARATLAFCRSCISPATVRPAVTARAPTQSVRPARSWMAIWGSRLSGTATTPMNAPTRPK